MATPDVLPRIRRVRVGTDGERIPINTGLGRRKTPNVKREAQFAGRLIDPAHARRSATLHGVVVDRTTDGADARSDGRTKQHPNLDASSFRNPAPGRTERRPWA